MGKEHGRRTNYGEPWKKSRDGLILADKPGPEEKDEAALFP